MTEIIREILKKYQGVSTKITFEDYIKSLLTLAVCKKIQPNAMHGLQNLRLAFQEEKIKNIYNDLKNNSKESDEKESTFEKKEVANILKSLKYSQIQEVLVYQLHILEEVYNVHSREDADQRMSFLQDIRTILAQMKSDFANNTATESEVNLFTALVGDCHGLTVACPAAGMAAIASSLKAKSFYLREISPHIFNFSQALLFLENKTIDFALENSMLKMPTSLADIVVLSPPMWVRFTLGVEKLKFPLLIDGKVPTSGSDSVWVQLALAHLNETGKAYALLPSGWFFRGGYDAKVRNALLANDYVDAIIALPQGILQKSNISPSMLILNKSRESGTPIHFVDATGFGMTSETSGQFFLSPEECSRIASLAQ